MKYKCKFDADRWQLYSEMRGANAVAADLSGTLTILVRRAQARIKAEPLLSEQKVAESVRDVMYEHMRRAGKFGAADSEPEGVLVGELERAFGLEEYSVNR